MSASEVPMRFYTIGYGGKSPSAFVALLQDHRIRTVVDVRVEPTKAHLGSYVRAKSPDKGIEQILSAGGIGYVSIPALGNPFRGDPDWKAKYDRWFREGAATKHEFLECLPEPYCLLCAEKDPRECHRQTIADVITERGGVVTHLD